MKASLSLAVLLAAVCQVRSSHSLVLSEDSNPVVLHPWRQKSEGPQVRVKRDWIIPPIRVLENSKQVPENLVQIKSDKVFTGEVIYKLEGPGVDQDPKGLFEIDDKTGWITSKMPLDREKFKTFKLKAFALSPSGERLESPTTIEIYVLDQNDHRPEFTQKEFSGTIPEFSIPGTSVMQVTAVDADDPMTDNAALSYSIIAQESSPPHSINKTMFGINNKSGVIYIRDVGLDRDVVESFKLTLQVADMSGMGLTSLGRAIIHISDVNNHAPRFQPSRYTMHAVENKILAEIGRVNATDKDEKGSVNWRIKYVIRNGDPSGHFAVRTDPVTNQGIISVTKPLDYESQATYLLTVSADNEIRLKTSYEQGESANITVQVLNENEAPIFYTNPIKVAVAESIVPGTILISDIAHDPDNSKLRFEIIQDPEGWLSISQGNGQISARKTFNIRSPHVKNNIYSSVIKVTDEGADKISTTAVLEVTLWETNDYPPVLVPLRGIVCSNRKKMGLVLSAVDEDMSPQADPFTFKIADQHFTVNWTIINNNETHAVLHPIVDIDTGEFSIPVVVSDSGSPSLYSSSVVNVTVCHCDSFGDCRSFTAAMFGNKMGISFIALMIIIGSILLLIGLLVLAVAVRACSKHNLRKDGGLLVGSSDEDIRDNVFHYDEQGGGEEDEDAFNIDFLRNPSEMTPVPGSFYPQIYGLSRGKQPLRKDAPQYLPSPTYPRKLPGEPTDIEDFINVGLDAADKDPNVPPYDTALIYDYEGDGSVAGSLSSIASTGSDADQDYDYLNDWGPRFKKLANMYDPR